MRAILALLAFTSLAVADEEQLVIDANLCYARALRTVRRAERQNARSPGKYACVESHLEWAAEMLAGRRLPDCNNMRVRELLGCVFGGNCSDKRLRRFAHRLGPPMAAEAGTIIWDCRRVGLAEVAFDGR